MQRPSQIQPFRPHPPIYYRIRTAGRFIAALAVVIAIAFGVKLTTSNDDRPLGRTIKLAVGKSVPVKNCRCDFVHTVASGDTVWSIAEKFQAKAKQRHGATDQDIRQVVDRVSSNHVIQYGREDLQVGDQVSDC